MADWPAEALAGWLRALGRVESGQLAARSRVLAAFNAQGGFEADGQASARAWLRWQAQITGAGSSGATKWMRRLAVHPRVLAALGARAGHGLVRAADLRRVGPAAPGAAG